MRKFLKRLGFPLTAALLALSLVTTGVMAIGGWTDDGNGVFSLTVKGRKVLQVTQTATTTTLTAVGSSGQSLVLAGTGAGTVSGVTTGSVTGTANGSAYFDASGFLAATAALTNGQLLVGSTSAVPVAAALTGTANQVVVTNGAGTITLSTPQSINTTSSPTFVGITATGSVAAGDADTDTHASLGSWTGFRSLALVHTSGNLTLTNAHCGRTIINNASSSTQTFTLPAVAAVPGCQITFLAGDAGGETLVNMAASGTCVITTFAAVGADADTAIVTDSSCDTGLKNTAATNAVGDTLGLVSDGTRWLGVGITAGIWASQ